MKKAEEKKKKEEEEKGGPSWGLVDLVACLSVILAGISVQTYFAAKSQLSVYREENLNITGTLDQEGIVFNRVPKVGSETIWTLIGK